jgi:NADPH2 dehydrogenase
MAGLASPLSLGRFTMRNRIIMPPMANNVADEDGTAVAQLVEHYRVRAAGGPGMIIVEHSYVTRDGRVDPRQLGICDDAHVAGLTPIAAAIHEGGALAMIQITHGGARCPSAATGRQPAGPSDVRVPGDAEDPRPITLDEIHDLPTLFSAAARRALEAGFDGVEVHGAHGYLLNEFASPYTNHRTDDYGGPLSNRLRVAGEVLTAVRDTLGDSLLLYRFGVDDSPVDGVTPTMAAEMAPALAGWGVDLLDCSGGLCGSRPADRTAQGFFVPAAAIVRAASPVPVSAVGGIIDPRYADDIVRRGLVDAVCVGRAQLKDPEWAAKALGEVG